MQQDASLMILHELTSFNVLGDPRAQTTWATPMNHEDAKRKKRKKNFPLPMRQSESACLSQTCGFSFRRLLDWEESKTAGKIMVVTKPRKFPPEFKSELLNSKNNLLNTQVNSQQLIVP